MKLWSIRGNSQKLDGGSMFGNAPKAMWEKWSPPDEHNRIDLACRALLASPLNGRTVLFETGIGAFFDFLAGEVTRAPLWIRHLRLEWLYRLWLEPARLWRRYVVGNPVFLMRVLRQRLAGRNPT